MSHTQRSGRATALASKLFSDLEEVWLDIEMNDKSEAAMQEGVKNSKIMIAIITDDGGEGNAYFERPFCLSEVSQGADASCCLCLS